MKIGFVIIITKPKTVQLICVRIKKPVHINILPIAFEP